MGRTQPVKALGSITSGWFPQLARRNALHPSKSNFCVPAKSALSNGIACAAASGSALHPPRKEGPFNLLMGAYSTACDRAVDQPARPARPACPVERAHGVIIRACPPCAVLL